MTRPRTGSALATLCACGIAASHAAPALFFENAADTAGLGAINAAQIAFADLNNDTRPDLIITEGTRRRVFLNVTEPRPPTRDHTTPTNAALDAAAGKPVGIRFIEVQDPNLPAAATGDCCVFADLDNDGTRDAIIARYIDANAKPPADNTAAPAFPPPPRTAWLRGNADGTFGTPAAPDRGLHLIDAAKPATTRSISVADVNNDGLLDLFLGNWYSNYGTSLEAFTNDLLLQLPRDDASQPISFNRSPLPEDAHTFDEEHDAAGRPTYGVMILPHMLHSGYSRHDLTCAQMLWLARPALLELNYGRRANRLLVPDLSKPRSITTLADIAPKVGIDGDAIRHGRYPAWLAERAKTDPRFKRDDEKPFRSHGNTFDAAVNDVDNDELMDLFVAEITHAWAGDSSDRSRFLMQVDRSIENNESLALDPGIRFVSPPDYNIDRAPTDPEARRWNQGDVSCELADFDNDGRIDLLLSSGEYPDEQRLRLFRQREKPIDTGDGRGPQRFEDVTAAIGLDHIGSGQISIADIDADGDLDIAATQSFNRLTPEQIAGRTPRLSLWINRLAERSTPQSPARSLTLILRGDPAQKISCDPLGATALVTTTVDGKPVTQFRPIFGIGGHAGKQHESIIHIGLGSATEASVTIYWPGRPNMYTHVPDTRTHRLEIRAQDHPAKEWIGF